MKRIIKNGKKNNYDENINKKNRQIEIQNEENINSSIEAKENKETEKVFPYIWDLAALIFITYAVSFAVYPGVLISYNFFNLPVGFKINSLIFVPNICDTIGRFIPNYFPGKKSQIVLLVFSRCGFLVTYPLLILIQRNYETVNNIIFLNFCVRDFCLICWFYCKLDFWL